MSLIVAVFAAAVIVLATFLPWQDTPLNGHISGFGSGGWATMVLGVIAIVNLLTWLATGKQRDAFAAAAVGGAAILASGYLLYDFSTRSEGLFDESRTSDPLIGVYIALGGAVVLTVSALLVSRGGDRPELATAAATTPPPPAP